jgi:hypothetical protein
MHSERRRTFYGELKARRRKASRWVERMELNYPISFMFSRMWGEEHQKPVVSARLFKYFNRLACFSQSNHEIFCLFAPFFAINTRSRSLLKLRLIEKCFRLSIWWETNLWTIVMHVIKLHIMHVNDSTNWKSRRIDCVTANILSGFCWASKRVNAQ